MNKTFLFIDGTNLYAGQHELFGPRKYLKFNVFIKEIEKKLKIKFDKIYFYASYSPRPKKLSDKAKAYLKNEAIFYKSVKETESVIFFTGYRSKTSGQEKEVDVKLTADIITFAFLNKYNKAYLFSGDADFLQALLSVRQFHNEKKLHLLCLQNKFMYQGIFHFKTHVISFEAGFKSNSLRNVDYVNISEKIVVKNV